MDDYPHLSEFNLNCTNLTLSEIKAINLARSISGFICVLISLLIICLLIFYYKSYKSTLQRLFLLFTFDTLAIELLLGLNIEHYFEYEGQDQVCTAIGFLIQWTGSMTYWCSLGIVIVLALTVFQKIRGDSIEQIKWRKPTEIVLIVFILFIPLLHIWPPFLNDMYGLEFAYCWIKEKDENCSSIGESERLQFFVILQMIELICVLVTIALAILYCVLRYRYRNVGTHQVTTLLNHTLLLLVFLVIHWLFSVVAQIIYTVPIKEFAQWMYTDAIPIPFSFLIVPFGFLVHLFAVRHTGCCSNCSRCCQTKKHKQKHEYSAEEPETRPTSHPVEARSDTYWSGAPYTNEFTSVVATTNSQESEKDALLRASMSDTGYGSHANIH